jgi:hypothetical protein
VSSFVEFEREVLRVLLRSNMRPDQIEELLATASFVSCEHTGGYFLTVQHPALPASRVVCNEPMIEGRAKDIECGFVVFLEGGELTLECHSGGDSTLPADLRERLLAISLTPCLRSCFNLSIKSLRSKPPSAYRGGWEDRSAYALHRGSPVPR